MNKLLYSFSNDNVASSAGVDISSFLHRGGVGTCPWHKTLSPFLNGITNLRQHFEKTKELFFNGLISQEQCSQQVQSGSFATAKLCPGISDLLANCFLATLPVDIHLSVNHDGKFAWNSPQRASGLGISVSSHPPEQFHSKEHGLFDGRINIKFSLPVIISTNFVPYIYLQPTYHTDADWEVVPGIVQGKHTTAQELNINTLVRCPVAGVRHIDIRAGTVLAYLWFQKRLQLVPHARRLRLVPVAKFLGS